MELLEKETKYLKTASIRPGYFVIEVMISTSNASVI